MRGHASEWKPAHKTGFLLREPVQIRFLATFAPVWIVGRERRSDLSHERTVT
jgi:hypothetical protein